MQIPDFLIASIFSSLQKLYTGTKFSLARGQDRRTKSEVEKTLPPKKEIHIKVGLTELQKDIYKNLLNQIKNEKEEFTNKPYTDSTPRDEGKLTSDELKNIKYRAIYIYFFL